MVKVRSVPIERLMPAAPKQRRLSPRQLAARMRERAIRRALGRLRSGQVVVLSPDESEKLPTLRLALNRVLSDDAFRTLHVAGRGGSFHVSQEPLPFAGRGRKPRR